MKPIKTLSSTAIILGMVSTNSYSQDGSNQSDEIEFSDLDRVTVTARRTEEEIQNVPGSVVVVTGDEIEKSNASDGKEVLLRLPNVSFTEASTPADVDIAIRGISNNVGGNSASGPAVGVFIDGVLVNPTGQTTGVNPNLIDLERVETVLGPQGTAFGRGALGGAINFVTKKPIDEFEASISTELSVFDNLGRLSEFGRLIYNAPILEDGLLSARFVAYGRDSDGFLELVNNPSDPTNDLDEFGGRLSLRSQPTDQITLDFSASFDQSRFVTANAATQASFNAGNPVDVSNFFGDDELLERQLYDFDGQFELNSGVLKSSTSFFRTDSESDTDTDRSPIDLLRGNSESNQSAFSQEFRYESDEIDLGESAGVISYNIGASGSVADFDTTFTLDAQAPILPLIATAQIPGLLPDLSNAPMILADLNAVIAAAQAGFPVDPALLAAATAGVPLLGLTVGSQTGAIPPGLVEQQIGGQATFIEQEVESFSAFGDIRWEPTDQLEIAVGARYSRDTVSVGTFTNSSGLTGTLFPSLAFQTAEETFDAITPNASVRYEWNENFSTYLSYSTGFRAGGFNATFNGINSQFDEETIQSFEGGFRASLFDNTLLLSASVFFIDYEDIQLVVADLVNVGGVLTPDATVQNAGEARSFGAEFGVTYQPFEGFNIAAQLGLLNAEFENTVVDVSGDVVAVEGQTLPNSPEQTLSIIAEYEHQEPIFFDANPFIRAEYTYRSDFTNIVNSSSLVLDGFDIFNLRAGLRSESFEVSIFAENLFDEIYATGTTSAGAAGFLEAAVNLDIGERRRFGVVGTFKF